jgi:hypothetical protein
LPQNLYYKLDPINLDLNTVTKKEIINDNENVKNNNTLVIINNSLNGKHVLSGVGSTAFTFNIFDKPTESLYTPINTQIEYFTESETAYGSIYGVQLTSSGRGYKKLPAISSIISSDGKGAILLPRSLTIGKISNINLRDIGVDYSADKSLRPEAHAPKILKISPFSTFKNIGISSLGVNYLVPPNLIVLDGLTNERIFDIDLRCNFKTRNVDIFNNTQALNEVTPIIIPINNSNGISIGSSVQSINFNVSTKDVTISFGASFSSYEDFPFSVGDKVLIENVSVGVGTTFKGYNSSNYNYALFTLTQVDPNIGGTNGSITYNLSNYLKDGEYPGVYRPLDSSGKVIPEKYFPIFNISLEKNKFLKNEFVRSGSSIGRVNSWDYKNGYLKISSFDEFNVGDKILAETSGAEGLISGILYFNSYYNVDSSSIVKKGWNKNTGFLNDSMQRLHDNDYYQYFSYSIRSKVHYEDWSDPVNSLNHTVGFKKFSDLSVESLVSNSGITTNQNYGDFIGISDLISEIELDCVNDFDLSSERSLNIDYNIISDEIILESKTIQDYIESVGNRVLIIDDISSQFNSNERPTKFSIVDSFDLESDRSKKYFIHVKDKLFNNESQIVISSLLHDNSTGFINQYGRVETFDDLGFFDFVVTGTEGKLLFYPTNYEINDYDLNFVSYDIKNNVSGIGTLDLGDTARLYTQTQTIPAGTSSAYTVVGIASTYRSSKVLIQYANVDNSYFEFDEITLIHNDSEVQLLEYGQLTTNSFTASSTTGLGTYFAYFSGSNINLDFIPNNTLSVDCNVNSLIVSIAKTSSIGVGTTSLNTCIFDSRITNISSSASPTSNVISEYSSEYSSGYYIVSVEDTTNNRYQISEILSINDGSDTYITEFGILNDGTNLGEFDATLYSGNTRLLFTPIPNINVQVRVFQNALRPIDDTDLDIIDLSNASLSSGYGLYRGTQSDLKRDFELSHKQIPIFKRSFVGSASSVVDIQKNYIKLPNNFFVTGEELIYDYPQSKIGTDKAIGIATTSISGIGLTDKLPQKIYAIKVDDYKIRFASTVENALKNIPVPLQINSLGVGTDHTLTSKKQNSRVVISIDNLIQSPIVSTSVTTTISEKIGLSDRTIKVSGISSFFGGDLIKVNDEIMRVDSVGFGSTNVFLVKRSWMGTGISTHANSSLVTKVKGNYNIVDNTINFITAPYGNTPIGTTTGSPDDVDYIGITTSSSFSGRSFIRSSIPNTSIEPYSNNYVFDDISLEFTGYSTSFILKSNNANITGFSTDNAIILVNQVFQGPKRVGSSVNILGDCVLKENVGLTSIQFTGSISSTSYDINTTNVPLGGIIVSVASTTGFGYQPLVSAGGTAIVSGLGTISSISIGNSGSGYRSGIQTYVNVGVAVSSVGLYDIEYVGIASISNGHIVSVAITNPGSGYTSTNPPIVIFDDPLPYSNIPLIYSSSSSSGFGSGANVNVIVGLGSSIINFEITNLGYGYDVGEILTIGIGGTVGIPTNTSLSYNEFQLSIDETYSDSFSGWTFGNLLVIDPIDSLFDGKTTLFPITLDNQQKTIRAKSGSNINVEATLLVFINDILQVPGKGYIFNGGSYIRFTEAPKVGDTSKILFYQGTSSVDVVDVDVLETIKIGDIVKLNDDNIAYLEDERIVTRINSTDSLNTNTYFGPGINENETYLRPLTWCKQRNDKFIDGKAVTKDRILYEPLIYPTTNIIQSVGIGSTVIFVESVKTFFDSNKENSLLQNKIKIISQDTPISAAATAVVSVAGTISSIIISNSGIGYTVAPSISISEPVGLGSTQKATAIASITSGIVTSINVVYPGLGYTSTNPPQVLIEYPQISNYTENIPSVTYEGDFGTISGISTTSVGVASTGIVFDFVIPQNSFLRNSSIVGTSLTISGIQTGYYFVVLNSNVGNGVTSLNPDGSIVSIGNSFLDNVYRVASVSIAQTSAIGFGVTYVAKVTVSVQNYNGLSGIGYSSFFGEYSWGKINILLRPDPKEFNHYKNGLTGISTSPIVERVNPLKYLNYI